jgi:putative transposase
MFFTGANMHTGRDQQPLSYDLRLPDEAQADALRLLDASRAVVNVLLARLWPRLDEFMGERSGPAGRFWVCWSFGEPILLPN